MCWRRREIQEIAVSLVEKIPDMSDDQVMNLLDNARRLMESGDERQKAAAAELLPVLVQAAAERKAARLAAIQAKRAAARPRRKAA
jgi:hypothetical protein